MQFTRSPPNEGVAEPLLRDSRVNQIVQGGIKPASGNGLFLSAKNEVN
jgi:hypothetical protein